MFVLRSKLPQSHKTTRIIGSRSHRCLSAEEVISSDRISKVIRWSSKFFLK